MYSANRDLNTNIAGGAPKNNLTSFKNNQNDSNKRKLIEINTNVNPQSKKQKISDGRPTVINFRA
jgi:hypothetical protein